MHRILWKGFVCLLSLLFVSGCGVTMRSYVQEKERVDQEMAGNAGYLMGTSSETELSPSRSTRKTYVLEFSKESPPEIQEDFLDVGTSEDRPQPITRRGTRKARALQTQTVPNRTFLIETIEDAEESEEQRVAPEKYTVQENDTLQKISKKFYGSYSKWPKIHSANKDKIKDPNRIKPGIVLTIPMD